MAVLSERTVPVARAVRRSAMWSLAAMMTFLAASGIQSAEASPSRAQIAATCQRVADVLSDGPDPGVDPVGYALAQIHPLREVKTTDQELRVDIRNLASAYEIVYQTRDKKRARADLAKARKKIDVICPGVW